VDPFVFQQAAALSAEQRQSFRIENSDVYLLPSARVPPENVTEEFAFEVYNKIAASNFADWNDYVTSKQMIYLLRPSEICPNFYICSCPIGSKKRPCKHNVWLMQYVIGSLKNPYASSTPLERKRKAGRPKKARDALSNT
jgi:hypothetical protein